MENSRPSSDQRGFTLLEMLVALSIIGIAALTLVRLDAYAVRTAGDLDESTMAGIVAQNRAVELWTDPSPPTIGACAGSVANAGRNWRVEQRVALRRAAAQGGQQHHALGPVGHVVEGLQVPQPGTQRVQPRSRAVPVVGTEGVVERSQQLPDARVLGAQHPPGGFGGQHDGFGPSLAEPLCVRAAACGAARTGT